MVLRYFRFDFKGSEGSKNNSFITLKHERPQYGEVAVGISHKEDQEKRDKALESLYNLSQALDKKVRKYTWNYHDAVLVQTDGFDTGLGVLFSSRLEKQGVVPEGSTEKFKMGLQKEGHELSEKDLSVVTEQVSAHLPTVSKKAKEKKKLTSMFDFRKNGRGK